MSQSNLAQAEKNYTDKDYLAFEREAVEKHEYINGKIRAMAGASDEHNVIAGNLFGELFVQLKATKCRAFASDMRVLAATSKKSDYFYPDIVVTCGERTFDDEKKDVLLNPKVVIEVLSKSTKLKDRNEKFQSYTALESLTDYVLVEQNTMRIEHYTRIDEANWKVRLLSQNSDELVFDSIGCRVSLVDIYNEVRFES